MTLLDVVLIRILFAASGSLVAGCAVWVAVVLSSRYLSAAAQQRTLWLLGQAAIAVVFMTVLLPTSDRLRMAPVIEIDEAGAPLASPITPPPARLAPAPEPARAATPWHAWLVDAGRAWLVLYLLGLGHALHRRCRGVRLLDALAGCGEQLVELAGHAGFVGQTAPTLPAVIEIDAPISPMLHCVFRTLLILPLHLRDFHPLQQALIIEHELPHWRRHDLYWSVASHKLQSLFWFNPFVRMLGARLACAQEFGCDRDVLRDRPQSQRKAYAAALLLRLKLQQRPNGMALAIVDAFDYGNRGLPVRAGVDDAVGLSELSPTLTIWPVEQTVFLRKLVNHRLPVSALAYDMTTRLLKVETLANGWTAYGKTGTASARKQDGSENSIGWFVGWTRKGARTLVFARLLEQPARDDRYGGPQTRDAFLAELARKPL